MPPNEEESMNNGRPVREPPAHRPQNGSKVDKDTEDEEDAQSEATKNKEPVPVASVREVFSFARTRKVKVYIALSFFFAAISGCVMPAMAFYFAKAFEDLAASTDSSAFLGGVRSVAYSFMVLGSIILASMTLQSMLMETAAGEMTREMKNEWFRALLRQDMAYYDLRDLPGQATLISSNGAKYRKGVGRKLSEAVQFFVACLGALGYSFYASWQVTLALGAIAPFLFMSTFFIIKITTTQTARANKSYAKAGSVVSTTVRAIRTILSLNAVEDMIERYKVATDEACVSARSSAWILGLANGGNMVSILLSYILVTLFGSWLIYRNVRGEGCDPSSTVEGVEPCYPSGNDVFGALFGVSIAASVLPQVSIALEKFAGARSACYPALVAMSRALPPEPTENSEGKDIEMGPITSNAIRKEVDALPKYAIDSMSPRGLQPSEVKGEIEFKNVTFAYPARPEVNALQNFSLKIPPGRTVALVGPSGGGKSTVTALLERFYDPCSGSVTLDGNDLRVLNVRWLREQLGLVIQEPKLFGKSIRENISLGAPGVTDAQVEEAARMANAHDFIMSFPKGYDTQVGDLGGMLSGGQRQRVAIARVLVRSPNVLILDEATSALDSESEAAVQQALDTLMSKRSATTIVIAHRLSTIKGADMIAVVKEGQIVETGTHNELLALDGEYASLVKAQKTKSASEGDVESEGNSEPVSRQESSNGDLEISPSTDREPSAVFQFHDVHHRYPSRQDVDVFRGLNLTVRKGETLALVGPSGCGKSSLIQLMEHFYQPTQGSVEYRSVDLRRINVRWLRNQIGLVGQEAVLFAGTIEENIKLGYSEATLEQVMEAARQANCHDFITSFPEGYQTQVGEGGTLVSGGQKQRIGIARAILRRPKVLLLDEATSALDSKSERIVQEALDKIMADKEQTVVVVAHRLSTIRNADRIAVIEHGKVKELGTHEELMQKVDGLYRRLQQMQNLDSSEHGLAARDDLVHTGMTGGEPKANAEVEGTFDALEPSKEQISNNSQRAWLLGKKYMSFILVGTIGALLSGIFFPAWGITFAYMIELFYKRVFDCPPIPDGFDTCDLYFDAQADAMQTLSLQIFYGYLGLGVTAVVGNILLFWGFGSASEKMNKSVRDAAFTSLVRQEVSWFDLRSPGTITSQLADDAAMLHAFAGEPIRTITVSVASVLVGLVLSLVYMWPFALLTMGILPFLAFGAEMEMRTYLGEDEPEVTQDEHSPGGIVIETLSSIRTVASLTLENERAEEYDLALRHEDSHPMRTNLVKGSLAGTGQFLQMWSFALMFWFGGYLLLHYPGSFTYNAYLISMFSLFFSMYGLTLAFQGSVDREKAKAAAHRVFALTDRQSKIDPLSEEGVIILDDGTLHSAPHSSSKSTEKEDWVEVDF